MSDISMDKNPILNGITKYFNLGYEVFVYYA